jgi:zinc/manganese transport system permease protein
MVELLIDPFIDYLFMRRALVGSVVVSLGAVPVGLFMTLRRMSLTGDAMAHAILPGAAIAYIISGLSLLGLTIGGVLAGLVVAALAGFVSRSSQLHEDTSLAAFYLLSLASGVLVISLKQSNIDLFHLLFGNILALNEAALSLLAFISSLTLLIMAVLYRPLVIECADPTFLRRSGYASAIAHFGFLFLMVINLVAGFHALGTLMAVGIMVLPATAARFWARSMDWLLVFALLIAFAGCYIGLLVSFYFDLPSGPAIIISIGIVCVSSILFGSNGGLLKKQVSQRHLAG